MVSSGGGGAFPPSPISQLRFLPFDPVKRRPRSSCLGFVISWSHFFFNETEAEHWRGLGKPRALTPKEGEGGVSPTALSFTTACRSASREIP